MDIKKWFSFQAMPWIPCELQNKRPISLIIIQTNRNAVAFVFVDTKLGIRLRDLL